MNPDFSKEIQIEFENKFQNIADLFTKEGEKRLVEIIGTALSSAPISIKTKKDRDKVASFAYALARTKTRVEDLKKMTFQEERKKIKENDNFCKKIVDFIDNAKKDYRFELTKYEEKEKEALANIENEQNKTELPREKNEQNFYLMKNSIRLYVLKSEFSKETIKKKINDLLNKIYEEKK